MKQGSGIRNQESVDTTTTVTTATAARPKLRYPAGKQSSQVRALRRFMPEGVVDTILRKVNGLPA